MFRPAGVQFFLRSSEAYYTPNLLQARVICVDRANSAQCPEYDPPTFFWTDHVPGASGPASRTIGDDILAIFPAAQVNTRDRVRVAWLDWASAKYRDRSEIIVWVSPVAGTGNGSQSPSFTQMVFMSAGSLNTSITFAHELGHFFALPHSHGVVPGPKYDPMLNPETGTLNTKEDWWDLVFGDRVGGTGGFKYFASKNEANAWTSSSVYSIDNDGNCSLDSSGKVTCVVPSPANSSYTETLNFNNSNLLEKSSFISSNNDNPSGNPPSYKYGANVMSYLGLGQDLPSSLSPSQILMVRRTLRYNVQGSPNSEFPGEPSERHLLGQYQNQSTALRLDVDGDGRRDIVFYEPPVQAGNQGTFRILLSSRSYSTSSINTMTVSMGNLGDIPMVGDFNGDGRDDVATWGRHPTSPTFGNWQWCLSPVVPSSGQVLSCSASVSTVFGVSTDIPLPGHRFSLIGPGFLAYYRPSNCSFTWRRTDNSTSQSVSMGGTCARSHMPIPGLYDDDLLTDLVTYNPQSAQFRLIRSMGGYDSSQVITRQFSSVFVAGSFGNSYYRSGAVPILGLYRSYPNYTLGAQGPWTNRLGFGLWQPWTGRTDILWNPVQFSTMDFSAAFGGAGTNFPFAGQNGQIPFGSMGTNFSNPSSGNSCSNLSLYSPMKAISNASNMLSIVDSPVCTGTSISSYSNVSLNQLQGNARRLVTPVADMDGDGLADIFVYDSDTGQAAYLHSSAWFLTSSPITTGATARAVLL